MKKIALIFFIILNSIYLKAQRQPSDINFNHNWQFKLGEQNGAELQNYNASAWRLLTVPHDWSIEGDFSKNHPVGPDGGALPGGIGWYRKTFNVPVSYKDKKVYIDFDGVYCRSTIWINGHKLGYRPNGFISFRYDLTPYLNFDKSNVISVKVDNSQQPNSRWYSGSGIYRNVWLVVQNQTAIDHWGSFVTSKDVDNAMASVNLNLTVANYNLAAKEVTVVSTILNAEQKVVATARSKVALQTTRSQVSQSFKVTNPQLWSVERPYLYTVISRIENAKGVLSQYTTPLGIRYFKFDSKKGFYLNGKPLKILGVCNHHDLGALGAAFNVRAAERQLELLRAMGCNAIRTSHNPPAPELLDLADRMGFLIMDEAFDMWEKEKIKYDYHLSFKEWHERDLQDQILRDRNHPSVFCWSIGNEIPEQRMPQGSAIARRLREIVNKLDTTRLVTTANNFPDTANYIVKSGAVDLVGYNYNHKTFENFPVDFPGKLFIATETTSALQTRGVYDMPSDSVRRWPYKVIDGKEVRIPMNEDLTCSAYDNVASTWGSTHEETWKLIKKYDYLSGLFIWTGFDYLGEPTPYTWPARSSYFGILDLAGFPKDVYYLYQSEWTNKQVLHIFPHWNWKNGETHDIWAYYNNADEVELFLNGKSVGVRKKQGDDLHVMWKLKFTPGVLKAVARKNGKVIATKEVKTAGQPAHIELIADRSRIKANQTDLSFITVRVTDKDGTVVPDAANGIKFSVKGPGKIAGVDNGNPTSHLSMKGSYMKAFHGLSLVMLQSTQQAGNVTLTATSPGLTTATLTITTR
ncbi:beta-galactosidase GalB [Mucilaginibacter sp. PAMB04274]|uniref:beta-galactosidase GalB n=1 Tax=Mucilaginibacter sp. PAMB04274 TaxID=3138568 RepID=UPI0031F61670